MSTEKYLNTIANKLNNIGVNVFEDDGTYRSLDDILEDTLNVWNAIQESE